MKRLFRLLSLFVLFAACTGAWAQTTPRAAPPSHAEHMQAMDLKMKAMREMHEKMAKAKTPEERNALMAEHMKVMHEGMAAMNMMNMMGGMGGMQGMQGMQGMGPMSGASAPRAGAPMRMGERQRHQMMEKRMDMMQHMMQMMMDRMPAAPAK